ncbi:MAG: D-alanine--D-alanine ligase [Planctomycetota bacterium]
MIKRNNLLSLFRKKKLRIGVLLGGFSSERDISLRSGKAVADTLSTLGYPVKIIDIKKPSVKKSILDMDFAFITLHGKFGEDGTIQRILERYHIPYTGSGVIASKSAFDKSITKRIFQRGKIPTAPYFITGIKHRAKKKYTLYALCPRLEYPVVIKPCNEGSSIGVSIVRNDKEFCHSLKDASKYDSHILIEQYVKGREVTVGILGNSALPVIEIRPRQTFFSYSAKYQDKDTEYILNPNLSDKAMRLIQRTALKAYKALGCSGFARVDLIYSDEEEPVVLEINTIPGMTERSLLPKAAYISGIKFPQLCEKIIELSLRGR